MKVTMKSVFTLSGNIKMTSHQRLALRTVTIAQLRAQPSPLFVAKHVSFILASKGKPRTHPTCERTNECGEWQARV
jgi:hypothetical protein